MAVTDTTIYTNTTSFLVSLLTAQISDPVTNRSGKRTNSKFVLVKDSGTPLLYPCITVGITNVSSGGHLGMQTQAYYFTITVEVEVWQEKSAYAADHLAEQVIDTVRTHNYGSGNLVANNLFHPVLDSVVRLVMEQTFGSGGVEAVHRRLLTFKFNYVSGGQ